MLKRTTKLVARTPLKRNSQLKSSVKPSEAKQGLKRGKRLSSKPKTKEQLELAKNEQELMWKMFIEIYEERGPYSEVSGKWTGPELLTTMFHHIYSKSKYEQWKYLKANIIIMLPDEHSTVESNMYKYPEVNRRREELAKLLNI